VIKRRRGTNTVQNLTELRKDLNEPEVVDVGREIPKDELVE
jgi:hypothetical protein